MILLINYRTYLKKIKNNHDVNKLDFLVPYFMDFKFFSDCCGERKGGATSFLLRFVLFVNKVLTLFICENCTAIGSGDNVQYT